MITLKDYAKNNGISYEAVRAQVARYKDKLEPYIHKQGRQQFLDDDAVAFLDRHRAQNPVSVFNSETLDELKLLREQKELLLMKIAALSEWKADNAVLIAEANQTKLALAASNEAQEALRADLSAEKEKVGELALEVEKAKFEASEALKKLEEEKGRKLTFKEFWKRRNGKA